MIYAVTREIGFSSISHSDHEPLKASAPVERSELIAFGSRQPRKVLVPPMEKNQVRAESVLCIEPERAGVVALRTRTKKEK